MVKRYQRSVAHSSGVSGKRVPQEREFERVGGTRTLKLDLRLIAATNRDLQAEVMCGNWKMR